MTCTGAKFGNATCVWDAGAPGVVCTPSVADCTGNGTATAVCTAPQAPLSVTEFLDFGVHPIGTTSPAQTVTIQNPSSIAVDALTVTIDGPFNLVSHCPGSLGDNASCSVDVTFQPAAAGPVTGNIYVRSDARCSADYTNGTPQGDGSCLYTTALSGEGIGGGSSTLSLAPNPVRFGPAQVGQGAQAQLTVFNTGTSAINFSGFQLTGPFALTGNACGTGLAASQRCQLTLEYRPTTAGAESGALQVSSDAAGSPHAVSLQGNGFYTGGRLELSPTAHNFGVTVAGEVGGSKTILVKNTGSVGVELQSRVTKNGVLIDADLCPAVLLPNASCQILLSMRGGGSGIAEGTFTLTSSATNSPHHVTLTGLIRPDFCD